MTPTTYTAPDGTQRPLAEMALSELIHAHKKAIAKEERRHTWAADYGRPYDNPQAEDEIDAMKAEIDRRAKADQTA